VLLRRVQYRLTDEPVGCAGIVRNILSGKFINCKTVLQRTVRDHGEKINRRKDRRKVEAAITTIDRSIGRIERTNDAEELRGVEGQIGNAYFNVFNELITAQKTDFSFNGRTRRPPLDHVNALLSFAYTLLYHDMRSALETVGLDPAVGFLHRDRPGRLSLALDLYGRDASFLRRPAGPLAHQPAPA
jgi:CRISPR-associated protein Cas1